MLITHLYHFLNVGLLQTAATHLLLAHSFRQKIQKTLQHAIPDFLQLIVVDQVHAENEIQVVELLTTGAAQDVAGGTAVQANIANLHSLRCQLFTHRLHKFSEFHIQRREIPTTMDRHHIFHHLVKTDNLVITQHLEPVAAVQGGHGGQAELR